MKALNLTMAFLVVVAVAASVKADDFSSQKEVRTAGLFQDSNFYGGSSYNSYRAPYRPVAYQSRSNSSSVICRNGICRPASNVSSCANGQCGLNGTCSSGCANGQCGTNGSCANGTCGNRYNTNGTSYGNTGYRNTRYNTRSNGRNYNSSQYRGYNNSSYPRLQSPITFRRNTNTYRPVNYRRTNSYLGF